MISSWYDKTINDLSNLSTGVTDIGSKNYWEQTAFMQLKDIFDHLKGRRYSTDYDSIHSAIAALK